MHRIPREYELLQQALDDMDTQFRSVEDFVRQQTQALLNEHVAWLKEKDAYEKTQNLISWAAGFFMLLFMLLTYM
jgi:hypothetical protein